MKRKGFFLIIAKVQVGENTAGIKVFLRRFYVSFLGVMMVVGGVSFSILKSLPLASPRAGEFCSL